MAKSFGTQDVVHKLEIEAVQTITLLRLTEPRLTRRVLISDTISSDIFRKCLHVVLYYKKGSDDDCDRRFMAGWIKESMAIALLEQPLLGGRLRRGEDGDGEFEIVSNDSGVRLLEAKIQMGLEEFLDSEERKDAESKLCFWKDIDEQSPQFSPLVYVQVTNFECGGYAMGISCSLLLADTLVMDNFLNKWSKIHVNMLSTKVQKTPIFCTPNLIQASYSTKTLITSSPTKNYGQTMIFKSMTAEIENSYEGLYKTLPLFSIEEAGKNLGIKMVNGFSLFVKESSETIKVEKFVKSEVHEEKLKRKLAIENWNEKLKEVEIWEGNKTFGVKYWIGSIGNGVVLAIPSFNEGISAIKIIVAVSNENDV